VLDREGNGLLIELKVARREPVERVFEKALEQVIERKYSNLLDNAKKRYLLIMVFDADAKRLHFKVYELE
jgi:hypothetical protein